MNPTYRVSIVSKKTDRSIVAALDRDSDIRVSEFDAIAGLAHGAETEPPDVAVIDLDLLSPVSISALDSIRAALPDSELIAVSSQDTSQAVLMCFRCGFRDFLLKPVQPEELKWTVHRALQRGPSFAPVQTVKSGLTNTILDIASATSPTVIRLLTIKQLCAALGARKGVWLDGNRTSIAFPKHADRESRHYLPAHKRASGRPHRFHLRRKNGTQKRQLSIFLRNNEHGSILLWDIEAPVAKSRIRQVLALVEYAELGLRNLTKLAEVRRLTYIDDLTELYNARYLKVALETAVEESKARRYEFSLLFIDLDRFKQINDQHGHTTGSELLVLVGKTLKNSVRKNDAVFRYGGDEFVVLLKNTGQTRTLEVAERLRRMFERRTFHVGKTPLNITVSIGVAVYPAHASNLSELMRLADNAMYEAKRQSRNAVHLTQVLPSEKTESSTTESNSHTTI